MQGSISKTDAVAYVAVQVIGGILGVALAHLMFEAPIFAASLNQRSGVSQWLAEFVATFGLIATIIGCLRFRPSAVPYAVGLFISAGYWFTSSTSFANPAVTIARTLTDSFSGIRPVDAPGFIAAQIVGAVVVTLFFRWLLKGDSATASRESD